MKKSELLEKLKDIQEDAEIDGTINGIEGLIKPSTNLETLSVDDFKNMLANNKEIKGYYTSSIDSAISKAIDSHDKKFMAEKLPSLVETEIKKRSNEGLTEDQVRLKELQAEIEKMKAEKTKAEMSSKFTKVLGEKGLPTDLIDFVLGTDEEKTKANIDKLSGIIGNIANTKVKEKVGENSYKPEGNGGVNTGKITWEMCIENPELLPQYQEQQNK